MKITIFGTGCPNCLKLEENVKKAVFDLKLDEKIEVIKITDIGEIVSHGIMSTPTIAIDGKLKSSGTIPTVNEIKKIINNK